jgi:hypothetical protein
MYSSPPEGGVAQPACSDDPKTRMISCAWQQPVHIVIPNDWLSGVYIVKLLSSSGFMRYTDFVVRDDTSQSTLLLTTSPITYQAYNLWGGRSLYRGPDGQGGLEYATRSYVVSFDRPYTDNAGLGQFGWYEYNLVRWVERTGYNVSYSTDVDTDLRGDLLKNHRLIIDAGHDEYWSTSMWNNLSAVRDSGISLAFFGANDAYWHIRLQSSPLGPDREVVCYKDASLDPEVAMHPGEATVRWQDAPLNKPEASLIGQMYGGGAQQRAPLTLANGAAPYLQGTSLHPGFSFDGLVGGEYDKIIDGFGGPSNVVVLSASTVSCVASYLCPTSGEDTATSTVYSAPSGAHVFDAGTFQWSWGLDDPRLDPQFGDYEFADPQFQQLNANLIAYLLA